MNAFCGEEGDVVMENEYVFEVPDSKFGELTFRFCGVSECLPEHSCGPYVRQTYILHYILNGKGVYRVNERQCVLSKGEGFLIEPGVPAYYRADAKDPWTYLWIGFTGTKAVDCVRDLGLSRDQPTFICRRSETLRRIVESMMSSNMASIIQQYVLQGLLYEFIATLLQDIKPENMPVLSEKNIYVERAIQYICSHYAQTVRVKDIADYICIDRSYLYKLFEKNLGISPQEFLIRFRIFRAVELLTLTDKSIEDVARMCGYKEAFIFSAIFKKKIGLSPGNYRRQKRKRKRKKVVGKKDQLSHMLQTGNNNTNFKHKNI